MKKRDQKWMPEVFATGIPCSRDGTIWVRNDATSDVYETCQKEFFQHGYRLLWRREIDGNCFSAFSDGHSKVSLSFLGYQNELRAIKEVLPRLPDFSVMGKQIYPSVTLTQFSTHTSHSTRVRGSASGMGYVLRLTDGRLIVVDGGFHLTPDFENDYPDFIRLLRNLSGGNRPEVSLWILTHPHIDHYGVMKQIKPEDADIMAFMATLPPQGVSDVAVEEILTSIPGFPERNIPAHTGDLYSFGDAELEIYYTCEENELHDPESIRKDANNQSLIFGIRVNGQQILFTGDARYPALNRATAVFGDHMHCEICQIPHHGRTVAGDNRFFEQIRPKVALWPACRTQIDYDTAHMDGVNQWIFGKDSTVIGHYVAEDGTVTLPLPFTPETRAYKPERGGTLI